jgi:hypothetical protein
MVDRARAGAHRAAAGDEQHPDRLAVTATARLGEVLARERFAGGAQRVELVGLGAVAPARSRWPLDLDDPLALLEQERGEPGAEAAAGLDRPDPAGGCVLAREAQQQLLPNGLAAIVVSTSRAPDSAATMAAACESRWASTPMTWSTRSASMSSTSRDRGD